MVLRHSRTAVIREHIWTLSLPVRLRWGSVNRMMLVHRLLPGLAICLLLTQLTPKLVNFRPEDRILPAHLVHRLLKLADVVDRYTRLDIGKRIPWSHDVPLVKVSHLLDLLFWLCGSRIRSISKQSFISLRRFLSANLWVTRSSGVRLYGVLLLGDSGSPISSRTCLCCKVW